MSTINTNPISLEVAVLSIQEIQFSLSMWDSDYSENQFLLNNLVATLLKFDDSGRFVPSLASSWNVLDNDTRWEFEIRKDYKDESGQLITASVFAEDLLTTLSKMRDRDEVAWYQDLKDWDQFKEGSDQFSGIQVEKEKLVLIFENKPEFLFNFLCMPYFGYWGKNQNYKDGDKFVSSGPYRILSYAPKSVELELRDEFKPQVLNPAMRIKYSIRTPTHEEFKNEPIIALASKDTPKELVESAFHKINLPPDGLMSVVLSPVQGGVFENVPFRKAFAERIRHELQRNLPENGYVSVSQFYEGFINSITGAALPDKSKLPKVLQSRPLRFVGPRSWKKGHKDFLVDTVTRVLEENSISYEIYEADLSDPEKKEDYFSNQFFDLRVAGVIAGSKYLNEGIEMMFCSKLGISFPDPNGSVCELTIRYRRDLEKETGLFQSELNKIVEREAFVVPFARFGEMVLFSPQVKLRRYPEGSQFLEFHNWEFLDQ